jgi:membrane protease YdiL (CAAX protease family)
MTEVTRGTEETSWKLTLAFMAGLLYLWGWLLVNVPMLQNVALIYLLITFLAVILGGLAYISHSAYPFAVLGFPPLEEIVQPTLVGATVGLLWVFVSGQIAHLAGMEITFYQTLPPLIAYLFAFVIASTEETLFRGAVLPSVVRVAGSKLAGTILTSLMFAAIHWLAFNAQLPFLLSAFLFSIVISALTLHYRTAWVAGAAHITYNLVALYFLIGAPF